MEPFKQSKTVVVLLMVSTLLLIIALISFFTFLFSDGKPIWFLTFLITFGIALILHGIQVRLDKEEKYTREFMVYIEDRINKTKSLEDLLSVEKEFNRLAIKDGMYCLSFPHSLKTIQTKILSQIEILEKINSNK